MPTAAQQEATTQQNALLTAAVAEGIAHYERTKAAGTSPTVINPHGYNALLNTPGMEPNVVNAMVQVNAGLQAELAYRASNYLNPILPVLTGQTASSGDEPTAACAGGPKPGNLKICQRTHPFGRLTMDSNVVRIDNAGELVNRGEFVDQRLIGNPFNNLDMPQAVSPEMALRNAGAKALLELFVDMARRYRHLIYDGNPANTAGSQGYIEYNGLDRLINTGYRDAITNQLCAAVDSLVVSFGSQNISGTSPLNVVDVITEMINFLTYLSEQVGLDPIEWGLAMRYGLFHQLTAAWPCNYLTYRCTVIGTSTSGQVINYNGEEAIKLRDDMRNNRYLLVDGKKVKVIIDEAVPETTAAGGVSGTYESAIRFVPLRGPAFGYAGGNVTYFEFFNWRGPHAAEEKINELKVTAFYDISPDGRYLLHYMPPTYWCNQVAVLTRPRLVIEAPFLAARLTNIRYSYSFHERSPFPGDPYFFNGGNTSFPGPSFYNSIP